MNNLAINYQLCYTEMVINIFIGVRLVKKEDKSTIDKVNKRNKKQEKPKKRKIRVVRLILIIILIILLSAGGVIIYKTKKNGGGMQGFLSTMVGHDEETLKNMPSIEFLILGESLNLTDTIMVASYNPKTQKASMMSIPRDTFVGKNQNRATAWDKINALYQGKYPEKTLKAVNEILGMDIKYYIAVDTKALRELVDAIGGVEFEVPIDMDYDDTSQDLHIHLKAGYQKLDGDKAEQVVRFRHNNNGTSYPTEYGDNDIGRMRTQREFITAVLQQTLKPQNILKIGQFLEIANKNVDTNIELSVAKDYIPYAVNFSTENLKTGTLPGEPKKCNGVWLYIADKKETKTLVEDLFMEPEEPENDASQKENNEEKDTTSSEISKESKIKIELLNGTGKSSVLSEVTQLLKEKGYDVTKTGTTNSTSKTSIINRTGRSTKETQTLKEILKVGSTSSKASNNKVDYTIIIGKDYK